MSEETWWLFHYALIGSVYHQSVIFRRPSYLCECGMPSETSTSSIPLLLPFLAHQTYFFGQVARSVRWSRDLALFYGLEAVLCDQRSFRICMNFLKAFLESLWQLCGSNLINQRASECMDQRFWSRSCFESGSCPRLAARPPLVVKYHVMTYVVSTSCAQFQLCLAPPSQYRYILSQTTLCFTYFKLQKLLADHTSSF